jgi:hypothetical protein
MIEKKLSYSFYPIHLTFISFLKIQNSGKMIIFQCGDKVPSNVQFPSWLEISVWQLTCEKLYKDSSKAIDITLSQDTKDPAS